MADIVETVRLSPVSYEMLQIQADSMCERPMEFCNILLS